MKRREQNKECLRIYESIIDYTLRLDDEAVKSELLSLTHYIVSYCTNYLLSHNEHKFSRQLLVSFNFSPSIKQRIKNILIYFLSLKFLFSKYPTIILSPSTGRDITSLKKLSHKKLNIIPLPYFHMKYSKEAHSKIYKLLKIVHQHYLDKFSTFNSHEFALRFLSFLGSPGEVKLPQILRNADLLLTSSSHFAARDKLLASKLIQKNKEVLTISHGEGSYKVFNEPISSYGEILFSTHNLTYGSNVDYENDYLTKITTHSPDMFFMSSDKVREVMAKFPSPIIKAEINKSTKILYIPTSCSNSFRYGPYRDLSNDVYMTWSNNISKYFHNCDVKVHPYTPKEDIERYENMSFNRVLTDDLTKALEKYDVVLFDFNSSASNLILSSNKIIIYFDIGLRQMAKPVVNELNKRCFIHKFDIETIDTEAYTKKEFDNFIKLSKQNFEFINGYTEKFCINRNVDKNENEVIVDTITSILKRC